MEYDKEQNQIYRHYSNRFTNSETYKKTKNQALKTALADRYAKWKVERFTYYRQYPVNHYLRSEFDEAIRTQSELERKLK